MSTQALPRLSLVVAYARDRVIGRNNQLPWHLPPDLAHFKRTTLGSPIIMGRRTWESLPGALPKRLNVVLSRQASYQAPGATVVTSLAEALQVCAAAQATQAFVIGGEEIFRMALPLADEVIATEIDADIAGDTWFPELPAHWQRVSHEPQPRYESLDYAFVRYQPQPDSLHQEGLQEH